MRLRESFVLYKRVLRTGRVVFYYQCYDQNGVRLCGHSTGQRTRTAAREFCNELLRAGKLIPAPVPGGRIPTFAEFSKGWWDYETCPYLKSRKGRRSISKSYAVLGQGVVKNHLVPTFGKKRLDLISEDEIDTWLTSYTDRGIKRNTANSAFRIMHVMMGYAVTKKFIKFNPCANVDSLKVVDAKKIEILTVAEVRRLFPADWITIWDNRMAPQGRFHNLVVVRKGGTRARWRGRK